MPTVVVTEVVSAPIDAVYALICDTESYPQFMKSIESIRVVERGEGYTLTEWVAKLQGAKFRWTEKDTFDPAGFRVDYDQIKGDLKVFRGYWALQEVPEGTRVTLLTEFEFGVPMLSSLLNPVAKVAIRDNSKGMLRGISEQARKRAEPSQG